jgi:hypothetical protein
MLNFKKIKDKTVVKVAAQAEPCKKYHRKGAYDCLFDCRVFCKPIWYKGTGY